MRSVSKSTSVGKGSPDSNLNAAELREIVKNALAEIPANAKPKALQIVLIPFCILALVICNTPYKCSRHWMNSALSSKLDRPRILLGDITTNSVPGN